MSNKNITVETVINAPIEKVWQYWNEPEHIVQWAFASEEWAAPSAENDLRVGGKFKTIMAAKDNSSSFDFTGAYTEILVNELIKYQLTDGRQVAIHFIPSSKGTRVIETFEMETENTEELQKNGWQAILDNFKKYTEQN